MLKMPIRTRAHGFAAICQTGPKANNGRESKEFPCSLQTARHPQISRATTNNG